MAQTTDETRAAGTPSEHGGETRGALYETHAAAVLAYCSRLCPPAAVGEAVDAAFERVDGSATPAALRRAVRFVAAERSAGAAPADGLPPLHRLVDRLTEGRRRAACEVVPILLAARAELELGGEDTRRLESHLRRCGGCRALEDAFDEAEGAYSLLAPVDDGPAPRPSAPAGESPPPLLEDATREWSDWVARVAPHDGADEAPSFDYDLPGDREADRPPTVAVDPFGELDTDSPSLDKQPAPDALGELDTDRPLPDAQPAPDVLGDFDTDSPSLDMQAAPDALGELDESPSARAARGAQPALDPFGEVDAPEDPAAPEPDPAAESAAGRPAAGPAAEPAAGGPASGLARLGLPAAGGPASGLARLGLPAAVRGSAARLLTPRRRRRLSIVLLAIGVLLVAEAVTTVVWEEPFTSYLASRAQAALRRELKALDGHRAGLSAAQASRVAAIADARRRTDARIALLASNLGAHTPPGQALGWIRAPRIGIDFVFVQGTGGASLRKGPGHYRQTPLPGEGGTVGIAGHRTTYLAPFRDVDGLRRGDRIVLQMPYGIFTYAVEGHRIVPSGATDAFRAVGYDRLVLSACHPLYSASHRILVSARLISRIPLGAAVAAAPVRASRTAAARRTAAQLAALGPRPLTLGMRGADVRELQLLLGVPTTGYFGYETESAVVDFERSHSLATAGVADAAMKSVLAHRASPPLQPPTPPTPAPAQSARSGR